MLNPNPYPNHTTRILQDPNISTDPDAPLRNLSLVRTKIDSLRTFLTESLNTNAPLTSHQSTAVTNQIVSSIHQIISNATALVSYSQNLSSVVSAAAVSTAVPNNHKPPVLDSLDDDDVVTDFDFDDGDYEIVELDAVELLAEHIHFCEICGKGFRRDANLRMHMRAHGNQFKTVEALAKPGGGGGGGVGVGGGVTHRRRPMRFSCPFEGCSRNKMHRKFKALKSVVCVRNHFKRSHCPKMYSCNRCNKKNFSVLSDLKSHMRHCGESKWKCSCGTTFSRKDKLFGHIALFEGHMPALQLDEEEKKGKKVVVEREETSVVMSQGEFGNGFMEEEFFDDFGFIDNYCLPQVIESPSNFYFGIETGDRTGETSDVFKLFEFESGRNLY